MTFPLVPLAATVELLIGGNVGWVDITEDVRLESAASGGGIQITRGRSAEGNQADPGRCLFTIDNRSGRYSPRNPMGEWYGLFGRNTPVRVGVDLTADSFTRTVGAAWGQTDDGRTWSVVGTSSEYSVAGSHAVQQHPTKGVNHFAYLDQDWQDIEQVTSASVPAIPVGASVVAGHLVRYDTATGDHYWLRLVFTPDAAIWVQILKRVGGVYTTLLTKSGVGTFTPGQKYNLRSSVCGSRLSVKAWPAGTVEPVDWTASITDGSIAAVGRGGLASRVDGGNTNISEVRFDDYRATDRRFFGEVSSWPIRWDVGGFDRWVPVEASGILRRLNQGKQQELSPLRRTILASSPLAYWPLEDGVAAQQAASAVPGIPPMLVNGSAEFVTVEDDTFGSTPTLRYGTSALLNLAGGGSVASQTLPSGVAAATDQGWTVAVAIEADVSQAPGDIILFEVQAPSAATFARWQVIQRKTTFHTQVVGVKADGTSVVLIDDNGYYPSFGLFHLSVWQSGTSIGVRYMGSPTWTTAVTGSMAGGVTQVVVNSGGQTQATPMPTGHVALWAGSTMPIPIGGTDAYGGFVYAAEFSYRGEVATGRLARLCAESGVPLSMPPVSADHVTRMGWQPKATLAELIAECVAADGGILAEQRDGLGLMYRPRESLYNQTPVPLSYTAGHISPPFEPVEDDAGVANDVTVTREDGSSYRAVQR
ncbi:hypothetical protein, partial [Micromonospora marina]|uniref:hypothetical protein n=1 Tax=Micromonospora marina TaxID=307120 RepID=UPI003D7412CB